MSLRKHEPVHLGEPAGGGPLAREVSGVLELDIGPLSSLRVHFDT